jgi:hypothetical protein
VKPREIAAASVAQVLIRRRCALETTLVHAEPTADGGAIVLLSVRVPADKIDAVLVDCTAIPA